MAAVTGFDEHYFAYFPRFISAPESARLCDLLWQELKWSQYELTLFGRLVSQPRLTAWYGEPEARYRYSGLTLDPLPWHAELTAIRIRLEKLLGYAFNSVLANAYRDGKDSMGWHSDDEKELGESPLVASVSLGAERRFLIRRNDQRRSSGLVLESGSLLVMKPGCQELYQHSLPKTRSVDQLRINLTFRKIVNSVTPY